MNIWSKVACAAVFAASSLSIPAQETTIITGFDYTLYSAEFGLTGNEILTASSGSPYGEAAQFDVLTAEELSTVDAHPNFTYDAVYQPGGPPGYITGGFDGLIIYWHPESNDTLVGHTGDVLCLDWKESRIASGARDNSARVWNSSTNEELYVFDQHAGPVNGVALTESGDMLASACADGIVRVFDLSDGSLKYELQGHFGAVTDVVFSPDGNRLVSTSTDLSAKVWDMESGAEITTLQGHNGEVTAVDWVENRIATSCGDAIVRIFDAETYEELYALSGHLGRVSDVSIAPMDTNRLVSIGADKQCIVWFLENEALTTHTVVDRVLNFGSVETDEFRDTTLWLTNATDIETPLNEFAISPENAPFSLVGALPESVPAMDSVAVVLRYDPSEIVADSARLTVSTKSAVTPFILTLNGMGAEPTSVEDEASRLLVYPNPAREVLFVQIPENALSDQEFVIVDHVGNIVLTAPIGADSENLISVNLTQLGNGVYFIRIGNSLQKFVIER